MSAKLAEELVWFGNKTEGSQGWHHPDVHRGGQKPESSQALAKGTHLVVNKCEEIHVGNR